MGGSSLLSTDDQAALLAVAGGAKLYEHLLTGRLTVTAASGTRIPHAKLQRLGACLSNRQPAYGS